MLTNEQKEQIESLTTEEIHTEIVLYRLTHFQRDEKYDHLKACYQQRTSSDKSSTKYDWLNFPLRKIAIGVTSACVILVVSNYLDFSL